MAIGPVDLKMSSPPPPPPKFCLHQFFLNVGNCMKREENLKFWTKIFSIFKKFIKNSKKTTFHQYQKLYSTPPWHGAKFWGTRSKSAMHFWVTVRKLNVTDGQTDRWTDGRRALQYLPYPGLRHRREIINIYLSIYKLHWYSDGQNITDPNVEFVLPHWACRICG